MLSSSFTMPSPCTAVHFLMGEPPPILLYCSWILGVRRLAISGANRLQQRRGTRVSSTAQSPAALFFPTTLPAPVCRPNRATAARRLPEGSGTASCTGCPQRGALLGNAALHSSLHLRQQHPALPAPQGLLTFELEGSSDLCPGRDAAGNRGRHPTAPGLPCSTSRFLFWVCYGSKRDFKSNVGTHLISCSSDSSKKPFYTETQCRASVFGLGFSLTSQQMV